MDIDYYSRSFCCRFWSEIAKIPIKYSVSWNCFGNLLLLFFVCLCNITSDIFCVILYYCTIVNASHKLKGIADSQKRTFTKKERKRDISLRMLHFSYDTDKIILLYNVENYDLAAKVGIL